MAIRRPFIVAPNRRTAVVALFSVTVALAVLPMTAAQTQTPGRRAADPFKSPQAIVQNAPERDYDLQHIAVTLTIDAVRRSFTGTVVNTLTPLNGTLSQIRLNCGTRLRVQSCLVDGQEARYTRTGEWLNIVPANPIAPGKVAAVTVRYTGFDQNAASFGAGEGGFHWIKPEPDDPDHVGFWTQGESDGNRNWAPTWDYPNDFATTETTVTVPEAWTVIGNGTEISNTTDPRTRTRTVHWSLDKPHATYLLSLVGGPFDTQDDTWQGVPLLYVVPKGKGDLIPASFGDTGDMLSFYSQITGVKYPWPKYAQNAMYDFGGGMENVSASTLGENSLTDAKSGFREMASLNSHELAHQWFGDYVTSNNWGDVWLNEGFASFFQYLYFEHSRGEDAYDREIESATRTYLADSRRYKRPIVTNVYPDADVMFDSHTYSKGGGVLHTLRRNLGDKTFFAGIKLYLTRNAHQPVETSHLIAAMSEASGRDLKPFFEQWVYKPGHPVLNYFWNYDTARKEVLLTVQQQQDTTDGTPLYTIENAKVGMVVAGKMVRVPAPLNGQAEQVFRLPSPTRPETVIFDPDHDFLREIPKPSWSAAELPAILQAAPNGIDRTYALQQMLDPKNGPVSDSNLRLITASLEADSKEFVALGDISALGNLHREDLRPLFRDLISRPGYYNAFRSVEDRRVDAIQALGILAKTPEDTALLRGLVTDTTNSAVVVAAVETLSDWDAAANRDILQKAAQIDSLDESVRKEAYTALVKDDPAVGLPILLSAWQNRSLPRRVRQVALEAMGTLPPAEPRSSAILRDALLSRNANLGYAAARAIEERHDVALLPALRTFAVTPLPGAPRWLPRAVNQIISNMEKS